MPLTLVAPPRYVLDERAQRVAEHLVIETDEPVDNPFQERQQRLLTRSLYNAWIPPVAAGREGKRKFWAAANVGVFGDPDLPPLVPDVFVSLDAESPKRRERKAYFYWTFKKPPEAVVEIVSNREGNELGSKVETYAAWGIDYYAVFDPDHWLGRNDLQIFWLDRGSYRKAAGSFLPKLGLGLTLHHCVFEGNADTYLRWCDEGGVPLMTGQERAEVAEQLVEEKTRLAEENARFAAEAASRADRLAARLRELGIDPDPR